jgi:hypothetical protein
MSPLIETNHHFYIRIYEHVLNLVRSSLFGAPIVRVPSDDKDTDNPLKSPSASPSMSLPTEPSQHYIGIYVHVLNLVRSRPYMVNQSQYGFHLMILIMKNH